MEVAGQDWRGATAVCRGLRAESWKVGSVPRFYTMNGLFVLCVLFVIQKETDMLTVRLPSDIEDRLNNLSKTTNRPKSFYVREALERSIEDIEDIYLAEKRLEDIRAGKSKTVPLAEVMKRHGMEG